MYSKLLAEREKGEVRGWKSVVGRGVDFGGVVGVKAEFREALGRHFLRLPVTFFTIRKEFIGMVHQIL